MLINQMKSIKDKVKVLLTDSEELRDNDFKLIANYYYYEIGKDSISSMSAMDLLEMFATGKLTHSESIRRVRQKLQEDNPNLRGNNFSSRERAKDITRNDIKNL